MSEQGVSIPGHDGQSYDLTTPRAYTARGGWNISCECGAPLGDTGYSDDELEALSEQHLAKISTTEGARDE